MAEKRYPILFYVTTFYVLCYLAWRLFFTLPLSYGFFSIAVGVALLIAEILAAFVFLLQYKYMNARFEPELPVIPLAWYPDVDVFVCTHSEEPELLYKTLNACLFLDYPDKSKVHVWLCDDTNRPEMAKLADELGAGYCGMSYNRDNKAGNLNNALSKTHAPLVATFDADMIPTSQFLMKTVPYFFLPKLKKNSSGAWIPREPDEIDEKCKIGFIQTPQSFYNPDLFQYNLHAENRIPNEQDYFFREINVGRNIIGVPIFAGTNTLFSRDALDDVGGIATGTITEDFETGINIQSKGWTTYAISTILAHGLAPDDIKKMLAQRERWGRGNIHAMRHSKLLFKKGLSFAAKIAYVHAIIYWWSFVFRLLYMLAPILFTLFQLHIVECELWQLAVIWLPSYVLSAILAKRSSGATRNNHWSNMVETILCPHMFIPILMETFGIRQKTFVVTNKKRVSGIYASAIFCALPHILLLGATVLALLICAYHSLVDGGIYAVIIIFWLSVNAKNLILALFFMSGRMNYRKTERFYVDVPVRVSTPYAEFETHTSDISETGLALVTEEPEYMPPDSAFNLMVAYEKYKANMSVYITHVERIPDGKWKYCVKISQIDAENKRQYYQIIYDRHHTLADKITDNWSMIDDYTLNVSERLRTKSDLRRLLPRIETDVSGSISGGEQVKMTSFNYRCITIIAAAEVPYEKYLNSTIVFAAGQPEFEFAITFQRILNDGVTMLYRVENWEELLKNPEYPKFVDAITTKVSTAPSVYSNAEKEQIYA
jgi:cellulose synthase (UDP-forming)